ncbi:MAG: cofactor-independent phosphoglycerate mutase [Planctomycetaceae bacterium]|nr:MAG: cofactor-independent phosphoglycerate mutase [Planctomycetaceae bacterium]
MKYAIIIPDGCADQPIEELGGMTPLQAARLPNMDRLAATGRVGLSNNTPAHLPAGSEVANLCLFGYDPDQYFTGRAPLEAAAQGIELAPGDWAVRCNLVTVRDQIMVDFTADHISTNEATELLALAQRDLIDGVNSGDLFGVEPDQLRFVPGVSYRNLLIFRGRPTSPAPFSRQTRTRAPHDLTDLPVDHDYPRGPGSDLLVALMERSCDLFAEHPINIRRVAHGHLPTTNLWLWGLGEAPRLPNFQSRHGIRGAMITAVDLLRGIAALVEWPRIEVAGATGYLDTDYDAKGQAAVEALDQYDIVCVHIEAPDEASHEGRPDAKVEAMQRIDEAIVGPIVQKLEALGEYRILISPDHPTPCGTKKHSHGDVPFLIAGAGISPGGQTAYDEVQAQASGWRIPKGWDLMSQFIR